MSSINVDLLPVALRPWRHTRGVASRAVKDQTYPIYEANVRRQVRHSTIRWMGATLDGRVEATGAVFEAKFMLPGHSWKKPPPRSTWLAQHVGGGFAGGRRWITGGGRWVEITTHAVAPPVFQSIRQRAARVASIQVRIDAGVFGRGLRLIQPLSFLHLPLP